MANFNEFLNALYAFNIYPSDIDGINDSFKKALKKRHSITFIPPEYSIRYVTVPREHPSGRSLMNNWSDLASVDSLKAKDIVKNLTFNSDDFLFLSVLPRQDYTENAMYMNLSTLNSERMLPYIKRHEYKHIMNHAIPYNLASLFASQRYNKYRADNQFRNSRNPIFLERVEKDLDKWLESPMYKIPLPYIYGFQDYTRRELLTIIIDALDEKLDDAENEENLYYTNLPLEEDWLNLYDWFLPEM